MTGSSLTAAKANTASSRDDATSRANMCALKKTSNRTCQTNVDVAPNPEERPNDDVDANVHEDAAADDEEEPLDMDDSRTSSSIEDRLCTVPSRPSCNLHDMTRNHESCKKPEKTSPSIQNTRHLVRNDECYSNTIIIIVPRDPIVNICNRMPGRRQRYPRDSIGIL